MKSLVICGRQPEISIAELESVYGADAVMPLAEGGVLLAREPAQVDIHMLGGSLKVAQVLDQVKFHRKDDASSSLRRAVIKYATALPQDGKIKLGLSSYGAGFTHQELQRLALDIKKQLRAKGLSVRVVPNKTTALSVPQVIHNQLTKSHGIEMIALASRHDLVLARTVAVQDIEGYTRRDQARPRRDARVGMLPPKLAQILINLANGSDRSPGRVVLDPFCGTGVVLQEALLMDFSALGTDVDQRMVDYTRENLEWLNGRNLKGRTLARWETAKADATITKWHQKFDTVACEGYLGLPFSHLPSDKQLRESMQTSDEIAGKFLRNLASQVKPGFRACVAMPSWLAGGKNYRLPYLSRLEEAGWKRVEFSHAPAPLTYRREGQIVGRELVVITRL